MMVIENKYNLKQVVYLKTDTEQLPRIVAAIKVNVYDIIYELACGTIYTYHYDFEISEERNEIGILTL